jgi:putative nucleotidyltransferase with HDIG domain
VLAVVVLAGAMLFLPLRLSVEPPSYLEGTVATEEIIAPLYFEVHKTEEELAHERGVEAEKVPPLFVKTAGARHRVPLGRLERAERRGAAALAAVVDSLDLGLGPSARRALAGPSGGKLLDLARKILDDAEERGLVPEADAALVRQERPIRVRVADGLAMISTSVVLDRERLARESRDRAAAELDGEFAEVLVDLVLSLAVPNLVYDRDATESDRRAARAAVPTLLTTVAEGERIVHAHERITAEHVRKLQAMEETLRSTAGVDRASGFRVLGGRFLLGSVFLALSAWFLRMARPRVWHDMGLLVLIGVVTLLVLGLAGVAAATGLHPFLVPVPLAAVVIGLLIEDLVAVGLVAFLSGLIAVHTGWGLPVALTTAVGGITAAFATRPVVHRIGFLKALVPVALAMAAVVAGLRLLGSGSTGSLRAELGWAVANPAVSMAAALFLLPLFEKLFGLASNITLLELSDLNRPLFRRMMLEANGTYHHSMIVGSLGEAAAEAVKANPLLARVGGYYHDIGKIAKWEYFGENLREGMRNPHERLTPHMSSLILESHVREGMELAREIGLPRAVAAFIPEHQGTTLMQYFYTKALELDPEVEELDYRYPGPRPQSRETAIIMLADAAEAIVRSLDEQSLKNIRTAIARLFEVRLADGQLDECGLTMADLVRIREAFAHVLAGVYHGRVKYQWQREGAERRAAAPDAERVFYPELETGIGEGSTRELAGTSPAPGPPPRR